MQGGPEGHSIIGEVAQHRLNRQATAEVFRLLGTNHSLASVGSWAGDVRHEIAISGRQDCDLERFARDLARMCQSHVDLFGAPAPFDRYLFQIMALGEGYGGLEHRSSTSLVCRRDELPARGAAFATLA